MKAVERYSDYLTEDNRKIITGITLDLNETTTLALDITTETVDEVDTKFCTITMSDGVNEVSSKLAKEDIRELYVVIKDMYNQM